MNLDLPIVVMFVILCHNRSRIWLGIRFGRGATLFRKKRCSLIRRFRRTRRPGGRRVRPHLLYRRCSNPFLRPLQSGRLH